MPQKFTVPDNVFRLPWESEATPLSEIVISWRKSARPKKHERMPETNAFQNSTVSVRNVILTANDLHFCLFYHYRYLTLFKSALSYFYRTFNAPKTCCSCGRIRVQRITFQCYPWAGLSLGVRVSLLLSLDSCVRQSTNSYHCVWLSSIATGKFQNNAF